MRRLAVVSFGPVPNQVPVWRELANRPDLAVKVFYATKERFIHSDRQQAFTNTDPWDIDLLSGYDHEVLRNRSKPWLNWRFRYSCPDIAHHLQQGILREPFDALVLIGKEFSFYWQSLRAATKYAIPVLYMADTPPDKTQRAKRALAHIHRRQFYGKMSAFLIGSRDQYDYYKRFGIPTSSMFWAPVCVDNDHFQRQAKRLQAQRADLRRSLGFDSKTRVVTFVGRFSPDKRPMDLLKAYQVLEDRGDYGLLFVGDGAMLTECRAYANHAGLENVRFVGFKNLSEISEMYAAADCLVIPSTHETWGLVVNEAMNFSLPVIASTAVGAAPDLVLSGKTGFQFPVGNTSALAKRIARVFQDPHQRALMAIGSRELISEYSVHARVEGILQALATIR